MFRAVESEAVKARLSITSAAERAEDGRALTEPQPTLIVYKKDLVGDDLNWRSTDRIRVESAELGTHEYEVQGEPQPMRKKRKVIGWQITLRRTEENEVRGFRN